MIWTAVGAVATACAVVVALGFGVSSEIRARTAERRLREEEKRSREEREARQARRVAAWINAERSFDTGSWVVFVEVQNASIEPIWNVQVRIPRVDDAEGDGYEDHVFAIVPPSETFRRQVGWTPPDEYAPVSIRFQDNAGRWWIRDEDSPGYVRRDRAAD